MGKIVGFGSAESLGRRIGRSIAGLGAGGPIDWWTVWYRTGGGFDLGPVKQPWAQVGWLALHNAYKPTMLHYNCDHLRLIRPSNVGSTTTQEWCPFGTERYDALLPGRMYVSMGAAKYWWVYATAMGSAWTFDGWLWANPATVAALRALPPRFIGDQLYIGG